MKKPFESKGDKIDSNDLRIDFIQILDKKRSNITKIMFTVIGTLITSIALSLSAMARTGIYEELSTPSEDVTLPVFLMLMGIIILAISIATSKISLTDELKQKILKRNSELDNNKRSNIP